LRPNWTLERLNRLRHLALVLDCWLDRSNWSRLNRALDTWNRLRGLRLEWLVPDSRLN
jgi:hypothetical protein